MYDCLQSWLIAAERDYESCLEEDFLIDHAQINNYEFDEDGNRV